MFDKLSAMTAMWPAIEKAMKIKKSQLTTADEFRDALRKLNEGATANAERFVVEGEYQGRPAVAVLVLK